ncbi:MGMT family protein [Chitinophaga pinensis]|uniref:Methylated-DNA-(Protein)-cysteine S-methyltransferase DNA binding n=1 Tax=Chitinophaga pinensis (strain ATCC 43595 / DSM 2588 / LMG 13176 / NBRC 15968 / NCIMB 11800 / UQM 2034) TaxID=485918 RepID=A0A979G6Z8_CHIPD|nr:MGMT family protein [Chitinophaga pinensis]ACU62024.1 Methylated-DNA-(protein)-cysteine S- methyltransferase DNA binding [Chitinophaga pinensis DSM 2588]
MTDPDFNKLVYEIASLVPKGRVTSYGAIAKALGMANYSRMVGHAMGVCGKKVPAQRVVNSQGRLTGEPGGIAARKKLLEKEGVEVKNDKIVNFRKLFWDPSSEL